MRRTKLRRLAMAITATALLAGGINKAVALEVSASSFVSSVSGYVANGDLRTAQSALLHLKTLGVQEIKLGDTTYTLDQLIALLLNDPATAQVVFAQLVALLEADARAYFIAENRTITSVDWTTGTADAFPTGSTG